MGSRRDIRREGAALVMLVMLAAWVFGLRPRQIVDDAVATGQLLLAAGRAIAITAWLLVNPQAPEWKAESFEGGAAASIWTTERGAYELGVICDGSGPRILIILWEGPRTGHLVSAAVQIDDETVSSRIGIDGDGYRLILLDVPPERLLDREHLTVDIGDGQPLAFRVDGLRTVVPLAAACGW